MSTLYSFDGEGLRPLNAPATRVLRYAAWRPDGSAALIVGNRGEVLRFAPPASFTRLDAGTPHNLRGAAWAPDGERALLVGNRGAVLVHDGSSFTQIDAPTVENLRRVAWAPDGSCALIVGNGGCVLRYDAAEGRSATSGGPRAHDAVGRVAA